MASRADRHQGRDPTAGYSTLIAIVTPPDDGHVALAAAARERLSPVILREAGFRLYLFSNEGSERPHVHVAQAERYAKYWLDPILFEYSESFSPSQQSEIRSILERHHAELLEAWHAYFGR